MKLEKRLHAKAFRDLLVSITPKEDIKYGFRGFPDRKSFPFIYKINGMRITYYINNTRLRIPKDEQELRNDIKFIKEKIYPIHYNKHYPPFVP